MELSPAGRHAIEGFYTHQHLYPKHSSAPRRSDGRPARQRLGLIASSCRASTELAMPRIGRLYRLDKPPVLKQRIGRLYPLRMARAGGGDGDKDKGGDKD